MRLLSEDHLRSQLGDIGIELGDDHGHDSDGHS